jgi:hypothetical protein
LQIFLWLRRAGATVVEVAGSHAVYVSPPQAEAALIETAAKGAAAKALSRSGHQPVRKSTAALASSYNPRVPPTRSRSRFAVLRTGAAGRGSRRAKLPANTNQNSFTKSESSTMPAASDLLTATRNRSKRVHASSCAKDAIRSTKVILRRITNGKEK